MILAVEAAFRRVNCQSPRSPPIQYEGTKLLNKLPCPSDEVQTLLKEICEENRLAKGVSRQGFDGEMMEKLFSARSSRYLVRPRMNLIERCWCIRAWERSAHCAEATAAFSSARDAAGRRIAVAHISGRTGIVIEAGKPSSLQPLFEFRFSSRAYALTSCSFRFY